jgi:hypothetical protein
MQKRSVAMRAFPTTLTLLLALSPFAGQGEPVGVPGPSTPTAAAPGPTLLAIQERRSSSFAQVLLRLEVPGVTNSEVRAQRVLVKKAVDDTGASLVPDDAAAAGFELNYGAGADQGEKPEPATFDVRLKSPARAAKSLTVVSGEAELFVPGRDPDSSVTVSQFASQDGRPISSAALSKNDIEITVLGKTGFAAEKKAAGEAARRAALEAGDSAEDAGEKATYAEGDFLSNFDPRYQSLLKVKDPHDRIGSYAYVDPKGVGNPVNNMLIQGYTFLTHGTDAPGADWGLRIQLRTPKSLLVQPFVLKDVPLP